VLTHNRPRLLHRALDSLQLRATPVHTIVIDNDSTNRAAARVAEACAKRPATQLHRLNRNLGCAGGRRLGADLAESELVLFLDDDAELLPGALDHLVAQLDAHPDAGAVSATVIMPDGIVQHSGGSFERRDGIAAFDLIGAGSPFEPDALPPSGRADWVPGTAVLVRRELLEEFPIDQRMAAYYEDNEWCYRIALARSGAFRRCREALALHRLLPKQPRGSSVEARGFAVEHLDTCARFYERHDVLLAPAVFDLAPELRADDGTCDVAGARLLMELIAAMGPDWILQAWIAGDLDGILTIRQARAELARAAAEVAHLRQAIDSQAGEMAFLHRRHETLCRIEEGGWWRLRGRVLPILRLAARVRAISGAPSRLGRQTPASDSSDSSQWTRA
jgi:glycosyltransferase involved in cell wall biosynthesis